MPGPVAEASPPPEQSPPAGPSAGLSRGWLLALLALFLLLRLPALFQLRFDGDELGLMHLAALTADTGALYTGLQPGLVALALTPFVGLGQNEAQSLLAARLAWFALSPLIPVGLWLVVRRLQGPQRSANLALFALAFYFCVPYQAIFSIQVRTDQGAITAGIWAAWFLLASRERLAWSALSGLLLGIGLLCSLKLFYLGGWVAVVCLADELLKDERRWRRALVRAGVALLCFVVTVYGGRALLAGLLAPQPPLPADRVTAPLASFGAIRAHVVGTVGWVFYRRMLPDLVPHAIFLLLLGAASVQRAGLGSEARRRLALAWLTLGMGLAVLLVHPSAYYFFWLTLGLFPLAAFGLALPALLEAPDPSGRRLRLRRLALGLLALGWLVGTAHSLLGRQASQRAQYAFLDRNFDAEDVGFQPESGLFRRAGLHAFETHFNYVIHFRYVDSPQASANGQRLIAQFRNRPVKYFLDSPRREEFPAPIREFWEAHYLEHSHSVWTLGVRLKGARATAQPFELLSSERYRWLPAEESARVRIDGVELKAGDEVALTRGPHSATFAEECQGGVLILALEDSYSPLPKAGPASD